MCHSDTETSTTLDMNPRTLPNHATETINGGTGDSLVVGSLLMKVRTMHKHIQTSSLKIVQYMIRSYNPDLHKECR